MRTDLLPELLDTAAGREADAILRACVHCGFCTATCPTYQLLGDELDGPRGRIYQIKRVMEGAPATAVVQRHLDRCLGCRACERTCPSGVRYARLAEIGRGLVAAQVRRPWRQRLLRRALVLGLSGAGRV
ncbi:4Fe-4S dicluster domain-containing protein, partial [Marichromatium gracile]